MTVKVGIVGATGYGGGEILRLCIGHPVFELRYVAGESTAGQRQDAQCRSEFPLGRFIVDHCPIANV
jgi:N-acetyl-gamma-glutamylphosphate reductase